jgi:hypothetical protein
MQRINGVPSRLSPGKDIMAVTNPEWLAKHSGELRPSKDRKSYTVYLANEPQYLLQPIPAEGEHACRVSQTINGKRLDRDGTWKTVEEAVHGGLEDLRTALGW